MDWLVWGMDIPAWAVLILVGLAVHDLLMWLTGR